ncbi:hypothetical protein [Flavobacterium rhizosphaerae]|uniref:DKNYY family protein n=1 Tax=Flavobacterium rhizosphaerae TaxID=3163298 RepID=A0ABW8Z051_9FLAO
MRIYIILLASLLCCKSFCQVKEKEQAEILAEARLMYNSERASWLGTDIFNERMPKKMENEAGGYFSYTAEDKKHRCIFYDRSDTPKMLASFIFDDSFTPEAVEVDTVKRNFTAYEKDMYDIKKGAQQRVNTDTIFKFYENTNYNFIPLITGKNKRVYILTGTNETGVVILGNDYLITFGKNNTIKSVKPLHKNIIPVNYAGEGQEEVVTVHSHLESTGDLITATDICTLLLYAPYARWRQHYVMSKDYVSIWDCEKETLMILTRKAWDKISEFAKDKKSDDK